MTLMIELTADEEAHLQEQARRQGQNAEALAHSFVRAGLSLTPAVSVMSLSLEADYDEDRPASLLAAQQRKFQESLRGQYQDTEMPPA